MEKLDDPKIIEKYDRSGMLKVLESFPEQCRQAKEIGSSFSVPDSFRIGYENIICTGLGGSAIGADIVRSYLAGEIKIPIIVNRNYTLPHFTGEDALVVASSYSGNTEETLSAYRDAKNKRSRIIAITSGGELQRMAEQDGNPCIIIPKGLQPRCAVGYSSIILLMLISKIGLAGDKSKDIDESAAVIEFLKNNKTGHEVRSDNNIAKDIANHIYLKYPVIYGGQDNIDAVLTRWRGQLAENSKTLASTHTFPEMNHNEIVGWEHPSKILKNFVAIILRDKGDHLRISRRIEITEDILKKSGIKVIEVESVGKSLLARIFSLIYIGDFVSYYLAILNGVDPTPVDRIGYLKEQLASG